LSKAIKAHNIAIESPIRECFIQKIFLSYTRLIVCDEAEHDGTLRMTAPVVALPEEKEKVIAVTQLKPPEVPSPPPVPSREVFSMECDVCGPYGFVNKVQ
jgi:hypothetical protein